MSKRPATTAAASAWRRPQETLSLYGHEDAETTLLDAWRGRQFPHAWLLGGPQGIGKATLAYRMARFALARPDSRSADIVGASSLAVDASDPVVHHVAAGTHGGLLVLERMPNDKGVLKTEISVEQTRETVPFFGATASAGGWRVCIVDAVEELNASSANALLKVLEEPPERSMFLLVSHSPARALPTILSRCRKLLLRPLAPDDVARAAADALDGQGDIEALRAAAAVSEGSVARALTLFGSDAGGLQQKTEAILRTLPQVDPRALHGLGDSLAGTDRAKLLAFSDALERWMAAQLRDPTSANADLPRLARLSEVWEKIARALRETQEFNLERKPLVFSVFGMLAEAMR